MTAACNLDRLEADDLVEANDGGVIVMEDEAM